MRLLRFIHEEMMKSAVNDINSEPPASETSIEQDINDDSSNVAKSSATTNGT
ncbi:MAG: hypothetical protein AB1489_33885 [Acidobacteriota bacterium]